MSNTNKLIIVLSLPRSGSSAVSELLLKLGVSQFDSRFGISSSPSEFNKKGYFEDGGISLLCDQLIRLVGSSTTASFLNPPRLIVGNTSRAIDDLDRNFQYDLDENTVQIPPKFDEHIEFYTGNTWDQWGISRMNTTGKWYRCYGRAGVSTWAGVRQRLLEIQDRLQHLDRPVFIKDPRLAFCLHLFAIPRFRCLWVTRDSAQVLKSMKRHYGHRLFTKETFDGFDWVSNHFNYMIPPQEYSNYLGHYHSWILYQSMRNPTLQIDVSQLENQTTIEILQKFVAQD